MRNIEVQKWGNSAAIRLKKAILQQLSVDIGSQVEVTIQDGGLFIRPITEPTYTLDDLLKSCTKKNTRLDDEDRAWLNSSPVGKEV